MSVLVTTRSNDVPDDADEDTADHLAGAPLPFPAANGKLVRLPVAPAAPEQRILTVEFRSPEGRHWHAIGGGATVAAAITSARESCPDDATWDIVGWEDLYGD
jgi:hypothetical protein